MEQEKFDKVVELIAKQLELKNDFSKKFVSEALQAIVRFDEKHTEKGLGEIAEWGSIGVAQKTEKKFADVKNWYTKGLKTEEGIDVEWQDLAVYALMGKLVENDLWNE